MAEASSGSSMQTVPPPPPTSSGTSPFPLASDNHDGEAEEIDIPAFRSKALSLSSPELTEREKEFLSMILKLTSPYSPMILLQQQLESQANIIASLTTQTEHLAQVNEDERSRYISEKDGWKREVEALMMLNIRRDRDSKGKTKQDLERQLASSQSDNRGLRSKIHDVQSRLQSLESELTKLRPLLLMQPFTRSSNSSKQHTPSDGSTQPQHTPTTVQHASQYLSSLPYPSVGFSHAQENGKQSSSKRGPKFELSRSTSARTVHSASASRPDRSKSSRTSLKRKHGSAFSDARSEHLILAARRIGRERAGIVVGVLSAEKDRVEKDRLRAQQQAQQAYAHAWGYGYPFAVPAQPSSQAQQSGAVNGAGSSPSLESGQMKDKGKGREVPNPTPTESIRRGTRGRRGRGAAAGSASLQSISSRSAQSRTRATVRAGTSPKEDDTDGPSTGRSRSSSWVRNNKRKRLTYSSTAPSLNEPTSSSSSRQPARVRSALDVLADQASYMQRGGPSSGTASEQNHASGSGTFGRSTRRTEARVIRPAPGSSMAASNEILNPTAIISRPPPLEATDGRVEKRDTPGSVTDGTVPTVPNSPVLSLTNSPRDMSIIGAPKDTQSLGSNPDTSTPTQSQTESVSAVSEKQTASFAMTSRSDPDQTEASQSNSVNHEDPEKSPEGPQHGSATLVAAKNQKLEDAADSNAAADSQDHPSSNSPNPATKITPAPVPASDPMAIAALVNPDDMDDVVDIDAEGETEDEEVQE